MLHAFSTNLIKVDKVCMHVSQNDFLCGTDGVVKYSSMVLTTPSPPTSLTREKKISGLLFPDPVDCFCGLTSWRYMLRLMERGSNRYNCSM